MNSTGTQLACAPENRHPSARSVLAHLLHALNQPLTGLQCSLELASSSARTVEQYAHTIVEGLELTLRMRILVEAIREISEAEPVARTLDRFSLTDLVREIVEELSPVAESRGVRLRFESSVPIAVSSDRTRAGALIFRMLESALGLALPGTDLPVSVRREPVDPHAVCLTLSWTPGPAPAHAPYSAAEIGLLMSAIGWEKLGGEWREMQTGNQHLCEARMPLSTSQFQPTSEILP